MRKSLILSGIAMALPNTSALAQAAPPGAPPSMSPGATSGGQTPEPNGEMRSSALDPYNSTNQLNQYLQRKQVGSFDTDQASVAARKLGPARPANAKELAQGATVNDKTGAAIATISSVDPDGVILSSGSMKVKVPSNAFGHNKAGLLLDTTKGEFEQMVAKANAAS